MKTLRFILPILFGLLALPALSGMVLAESKPYRDIQRQDWFYADVIRLTGQGILHGFPDGTFRPSQVIQTDQFLKMVVLGFGEIDTSKEGYWASPYIRKAVSMGLIHEHEISAPTAPINRGMIALILSRALVARVEDIPLLKYTLLDVKGYTPSMYAGAVHHAFSAGIITGYPDHTYRYASFLTRAEACAVINRLFAPTFRRESNDTGNLLVPASFFPFGHPEHGHSFLQIQDSNIPQIVKPEVFERVLGCMNVLYDGTGYLVVDYRYFDHAEYVQVDYFFNRLFSSRPEYSLFTFRFYNRPSDYPEIEWGYDTMHVKLELKRLWWYHPEYPDQRIGEVFYEYKLAGALCSIFGEAAGKKLSEFILHRYRQWNPSVIEAAVTMEIEGIRCIHIPFHENRGFHFTFSTVRP